MQKKNRTSSRRVFRWECGEVELIPIVTSMTEYTERLARIAEELYFLMNQLHNQSISKIYPGETLEPKSKGDFDGNESVQKAA